MTEISTPTDEPQSEAEQLRAEVAALRMALSTAERERDEWRIVAQQCGYQGNEEGEKAKTVEKL
ncbi:hypothetical protein EON80_32180 [bacterium]|nr:MAG: hypothetical protein EON80_32180 [bacterium]